MKRAMYAVLAVIVVVSAVIVGARVREKINEKRIEVATEAAIERQLTVLKKQRPEMFQGEQGKAAEQNYRIQIEQQVKVNEVMKQEAEARGVVASEPEIDTAIAQVRAAYGDDKKFNAALKNQGMTLEQYEASIKDQITMNKLMAAVSSEAKVSDKEARDFYQANQDKYKGSASKPKPYKDVESEVKRELQAQKQRETFNKFMLDVRKKAGVL